MKVGKTNNDHMYPSLHRLLLAKGFPATWFLSEDIRCHVTLQDSILATSVLSIINSNVSMKQVHSLRHDLEEKNALLSTVQKQLSKHQPNGTTGNMTNESTTGRVIEHLQAEIDSLKKELAESKTLIHVAKVARERAERQVSEHLASHQTLRLEIDSLKRMFERKERQSKELEESTKDIEKRNSDMKFERDNAYTRLRQSELKVSDLERKLQEALALKEKSEIEYSLLSKEMQSFKTRYANDVEIVKKEFKILRKEMSSTSRSLEDVVLMTSVKVEEITSERTEEIGNLESIADKLKENQEKHAQKLLKEIEAMKKDVEHSSQKTSEHIMNELEYSSLLFIRIC
ncbi:10338_t:CDS:2 [Funneliformis mosseae]|uniref:SWI5-dependent HO expression protein 3 n=1 Tax=Funneliformis mosseae TaxID=27381 RepID=A0A9N9DNC9_FUNMO|nr:10338_t:CDS:2 [Funneliformis mosseae]